MTPPRRQPPFERAGLAVLVAVVLLVTAAKLAIVLSGPDYDGDAYAHAMAGRRMLLTPGDVAIHWVWLPLLHVLHAAATAAGGGLTTIRVLNTLLSSASAFLLAWSLRDHARRAPESGAGESGEAESGAGESGAGESGAAPSAGAPVSPSIVPWLAGALLALDPLSLWLGVTGQTEPLFQLLVLGVCVLCERRAFVAAGALFAAAALTRYEAWPLLAAGLWLAARDRPLRLRTQALWLLPAAAVSGWCLFHFRATGEPLQFLRLNSEFVDGYLRGVGYPWEGPRSSPSWPSSTSPSCLSGTCSAPRTCSPSPPSPAPPAHNHRPPALSHPRRASSRAPFAPSLPPSSCSRQPSSPS